MPAVGSPQLLVTRSVDVCDQQVVAERQPPAVGRPRRPLAAEWHPQRGPAVSVDYVRLPRPEAADLDALVRDLVPRRRPDRPEVRPVGVRCATRRGRLGLDEAGKHDERAEHGQWDETRHAAQHRNLLLEPCTDLERFFGQPRGMGV